MAVGIAVAVGDGVAVGVGVTVGVGVGGTPPPAIMLSRNSATIPCMTVSLRNSEMKFHQNVPPTLFGKSKAAL